MPMMCGCGVNHHIDGSELTPTQFLAENHLNPEYKAWVRKDQLVLSWIVASILESFLSQLVGTSIAREAWEKLVAANALGSNPLIRELKMQLHTLHRASIDSYVQKAKDELLIN